MPSTTPIQRATKLIRDAEDFAFSQNGVRADAEVLSSSTRASALAICIMIDDLKDCILSVGPV